MSKAKRRPTFIVPNLSKTCERGIFGQIQINFEDIIYKYPCGFRLCYSAQRFLITLISQKREDSGGAFHALLTDMSIVFD